jgi:uncharacterized LabA/DUF88 family protein
MMGKPTMVFIDAQNLFHGAKSYEEGYKTNMIKIVEELGSGRDIIRSYYFDSFKPGKRDDKEGFYTFLETNGFRVDAKPLRKRGDKFVEKGADIGLATEMIARGFNGSYDVAVLVSGDNDFARAVRYVQDQGKKVEVASFEKTMSSDLKRVADDSVVLDNIAEKIRMEK